MRRNISRNSTYIEKAVRHSLLSALIGSMWARGLSLLEIYSSEVDNQGHDVVLSTDRVTRHVQLKASKLGARRRSADVNVGLAKKPSGCVIWIYYDHRTLEIKDYYFFGGRPGRRMSLLQRYKTARNTRRNSAGIRTRRRNVKLVPKARFEHVESIEGLVRKLFGE
jgi:hypothetical protein